METKDKYYTLPNEIKYDGMLFNGDIVKPEIISRFHEIETTEKDIIVATSPKSGTTWLSEIIYILKAKDKFEASKEKKDRTIYLDLSFPGAEDPVSHARSRYGEDRVFKTHLPAKYFSRQIEDGQAKIVVLIRNPKDVLVSYYHFYLMSQAFGPYTGSWNEFFDLFRYKGLFYGDWLDFNKSYWPFKSTKRNLLFLTYEDMKMNIRNCVEELAAFLGMKCTAEEIDDVCKLVDIGYMKKNEAVNMKDNPGINKDMDFIGEGRFGGWKKVFTVEQSEYVDKLYAEEIKRLGLPIIYG